MEQYPLEGVSIECLENNDAYQKFIKKQDAYKNGFVRLMPYNQVMPKEYIKYAKVINEFEIHNTDVWISSFPKCGKSMIFSIIYC